jgi:hypothetical protein
LLEPIDDESRYFPVVLHHEYAHRPISRTNLNLHCKIKELMHFSCW